MSIITLLTDFGLEDNFVGVMKGVILGINPDVRIVDITHNIRPHDVMEGALLLNGSYRFFPKGAIHLVVVDPGVGSSRKAIIVKTKDYIFVGPDNGVLSLALKGCKVSKIINITNTQYLLKPISNTFHGRDIFAPVAGYLSIGVPIEKFGKTMRGYKKVDIPKGPRVIYIDRFGNLITNISSPCGQGLDIPKGIKGKIQFKGTSIDKISSSYAEVGVGKPLAIFGSFGYLEISIREGNAMAHFHAKIGDEVKIGKM